MAMSPRLLRPLATGFNPRSIADLAVWYDASVASSITIATGVEQWNDLSGNDRHLTQTITNNQPAYITNLLNGKPALRFDGSNDSLSASFTLGTNTRVFCVGNYLANTVNRTLFDGPAGNTGNTMRHYISTTTRPGAFGGAALVAAADTTVTGWFIWETVFAGLGGLLIRDGVTLASGNIGTASPGGVRLGIFGNGSSNPANCEIAEFLIYSRVISNSESARVRSYLGRKYAITVT
jgi:hypothetical protein